MAKVSPSVVLAARMLREIAQRRECGVSELARRVGRSKGTVHGVLKALEQEGMVLQDPHSGRYRLGMAAFEVGMQYLAASDLAADGSQAVQRVASRTGETSQLAVLDGTQVVYIAKQDGVEALRLVSSVGKRLPAHVTALGKAMLAFLPMEEVEKLYRGYPFPPITPRSIVTWPRLQEELARSRERGFAVDREESNAGVECIGVPVWDWQGKVVAGMSVSFPTSREAEKWDRMLTALVEESMHLSQRLGARPHVFPAAWTALGVPTLDGSRR
jgi:IclR family KDG regulon transcriptional repressor